MDRSFYKAKLPQTKLGDSDLLFAPH